jgi:Cu(I)/Ag(I) efflux system membrane fusion protein
LDSEASLKGVTSRMLPMVQTSSGMQSQSNMAVNMPTHMTSSANIHHGMGVVESIKPDQITISHQPIPTLQWGAMTMGFMPPQGGVPKDIHQGDHVVFAITPSTDKDHDGSFVLTTIAHAGATP